MWNTVSFGSTFKCQFVACYVFIFIYILSVYRPFSDRVVVVVVDLPLLRIPVEGSDNPIIQSSPARRPFHLTSRGTTLSRDIQGSSMLLEVYKCVQLNRWSVVCGCVLQRGQRGQR